MLKTYSVSLAVGVLAGVIYAVLDVNSPAPPINLRWFRHEYIHKIGDTPPPSGDKPS